MRITSRCASPAARELSRRLATRGQWPGRWALAGPPTLTAACCLWQGYTGFLPGGQHHMAKTYGQASKAALAER